MGKHFIHKVIYWSGPSPRFAGQYGNFPDVGKNVEERMGGVRGWDAVDRLTMGDFFPSASTNRGVPTTQAQDKYVSKSANTQSSRQMH